MIDRRLIGRIQSEHFKLHKAVYDAKIEMQTGSELERARWACAQVDGMLRPGTQNRRRVLCHEGGYGLTARAALEQWGMFADRIQTTTTSKSHWTLGAYVLGMQVYIREECLKLLGSAELSSKVRDEMIDYFVEMNVALERHKSRDLTMSRKQINLLHDWRDCPEPAMSGAQIVIGNNVIMNHLCTKQSVNVAAGRDDVLALFFDSLLCSVDGDEGIIALVESGNNAFSGPYVFRPRGYFEHSLIKQFLESVQKHLQDICSISPFSIYPEPLTHGEIAHSVAWRHHHVQIETRVRTRVYTPPYAARFFETLLHYYLAQVPGDQREQTGKVWQKVLVDMKGVSFRGNPLTETDVLYAIKVNR